MADAPKFNLDLSEAQNALRAFVARDGKEAADDLARLFANASTRIARELDRAARGGELSLKRLAGGVLADLARTAIDGAFGAGPKSAQSAAQAVNVVFNLGAGADAESIRRSRSQIAAQISRAVEYGNRNR